MDHLLSLGKNKVEFWYVAFKVCVLVILVFTWIVDVQVIIGDHGLENFYKIFVYATTWTFLVVTVSWAIETWLITSRYFKEKTNRFRPTQSFVNQMRFALQLSTLSYAITWSVFTFFWFILVEYGRFKSWNRIVKETVPHILQVLLFPQIDQVKISTTLIGVCDP